jgi:hypothetical protein
VEGWWNNDQQGITELFTEKHAAGLLLLLTLCCVYHPINSFGPVYIIISFTGNVTSKGVKNLKSVVGIILKELYCNGLYDFFKFLPFFNNDLFTLKSLIKIS